MHRLRVKYEKSGVGIYFSHLEVVRAIERSLRRADFPFTLSGGYSPRPRISHASPLPVGYEGLGEYFDVLLHKRLNRIEAGRRLVESFPEGFKFLDLKYVSLDSPSLMQLSNYGLYRVQIKEREFEVKVFEVKVFQEAILSYVTSPRLSYSYRGKEIELERETDYPLVRFHQENLSIDLLLPTGARKTIRPEVFLKPLLERLKIPLRLRISRLNLYFKRAERLLDLLEI